MAKITTILPGNSGGGGGISLSDISAQLPIIYNNTSGVISSQQSSSLLSGYLSLTDWNIFNSKQNTLIEGVNINIDNTNPLAPVISSTGGGNFIPLTGTTVGNPVTGDIEVQESVKIKHIGVGYSSLINFEDGGINFQGINSNSETYGFSINQAGEFNFDSTVLTSRGHTSSTDFSPNITDLDYTQKIYVDNAINNAIATPTLQQVTTAGATTNVPINISANTNYYEAAITASSSIGYGVTGNSISGIGVSGFSDSGAAIAGETNGGYGLTGSALNGIGIFGYSATGTAFISEISSSSFSNIAEFKKEGINQASISHDGKLSANSFIKSGGTAFQFLKADGSVDSTEYATKKITVRKISTATTLANSDNNTVILLTGSCTITLPDGLVEGFNCSFATQAGATLTYTLGGSVTLINNSSLVMPPLSSHTLVNTGTVNEYLTVGL